MQELRQKNTQFEAAVAYHEHNSFNTHIIQHTARHTKDPFKNTRTHTIFSQQFSASGTSHNVFFLMAHIILPYPLIGGKIIMCDESTLAIHTNISLGSRASCLYYSYHPCDASHLYGVRSLYDLWFLGQHQWFSPRLFIWEQFQLSAS